MKQIPSEKSFSLVFFVVFALATFIVKKQSFWFFTFLLISLSILLLGYFRPRTLRVPNVIWYEFGLLISRLMQPLILSLVYFILINPIGLLMRLFNQSTLELKRPKRSTWSEPTPKTNFDNMF